jgi:hypothetical protein
MLRIPLPVVGTTPAPIKIARPDLTCDVINIRLRAELRDRIDPNAFPANASPGVCDTRAARKIT